MKKISYYLFTMAFAALSMSHPTKVGAIIFLPAVVLIPVVQIIGALIGALAVPVAGITTLWAKAKKKNLVVAWLVAILILILTAAILAVILKINNPERPLF